MSTADVAVVGGGMAGVSIGAELAAAGVRVTLLETEADLGAHTTARSAAQFQVSNGPAPIRKLTRSSRQLFDAIGAEAGTPALTPRPTAWVADEADRGVLDALVAAEPTVRAIDIAELRELCPAWRADRGATAAVEMDASDIDVDVVFQAFLRRLRHGGGTVLRSARLLGGRRTGSAWELETAAGPLSAGVVVNAAGAWADECARLLGVRPLGLRPFRRTAAVARVSARPVGSEWAMVADAASRFYFRPEAGGVLVSLAEETPSEPCDARPDELDVALALERVNEATDLRIRSVVRAWAGLRTFAPDRLPVVGPDPEEPSYVWLAGQGGYGIQTAPALAAYAASVVLGSAEPVVELSPARFGSASSTSSTSSG